MDSLLGNDERGKRESLALLQRAVRGQWKLKPQWYENLPEVVERIATTCADPRTRLVAVRLLHLMSRDGLDAALALERLHAEGEIVSQLVTLTYKIVEAQRPPKQIVSIQNPSDNGGNGTEGGSDERSDD